MKKILFTNVGFKNFAGSEIATMTLANYFVLNEYKVDIFTLEYDSPLNKIINKKITVITLNNIEDLDNKYDLIWAHHFPLLDYILFNRKIQGKKIYYESLSYKLPIEAFPLYYQELSLTGVVSQRVKNALKDKGFDTSNSYVLSNYAIPECFEIQYQPKSKIERIAIVSNHVPQELLAFRELAKSKNIEVTIYGMGHKVEFITPELLADYDVVISIGKTIFFTLAIGIPSYSYDDHVSIGYITKDNVDRNLHNNFASWEGYKAKTPDEIYKDIIDNYQNVISDIDYLKKYAYENFNMKDLIDDIINRINKSPDIDYSCLYKKYKTLEYTSSLYVDDLSFAKSEIMRWYNKSLELGDLYQEEIKKTINYYEMYVNEANELQSVLNSKGWKFLNKIRRIKRLFIK